MLASVAVAVATNVTGRSPKAASAADRRRVVAIAVGALGLWLPHDVGSWRRPA